MQRALRVTDYALANEAILCSRPAKCTPDPVRASSVSRRCLSELGTLLSQRGEHQQAEELCRRAHRAAETTLPSSETAAVAVKLGHVLVEAQKSRRAGAF